MSGTLLSELGNSFVGLPTEVVVLRLLAAALLGGVIGLEREIRSKPAGLRTHMLIALAACLFTLLAFDIIETADPQDTQIRIDPLRLIEAVTAGVAFLAAGAIIQSQGAVHGLTTGAGMWLAGAIGLACGSGRLLIAAIATAVAIIVLWLLRRLERNVLSKKKHDGKP